MSNAKSPIRKFFGAVASVFDWIRKLLFAIFLLVSAGLIYLAWSGGPPVTVDDGVAMVLVPFGQIVDHNDADPRSQAIGELMGEQPAVTVLGDMLEAVDAAAKDQRIKLLFLKLDTGFFAGQAQLRELQSAIQDFKAASGKPVYAYAPNMGQSEYQLAAAADKVFIDPMGLVFFPGFENYPLYFQEALDKLGVNVHVFRVGEFKSAVEPFLRNSMSDAARQNAQGWLDGLWSGWLDSVAQARGVEPQALRDYTEEFNQGLLAHGGDTAQWALQSGLVDVISPLHELRQMTGEIVGMDEELGSFRQIDHRRYLRAIRHEESDAAGDSAKPAKISVVYVQGEIVDGESAPGLAGGDSVRRLIDQARDDEDSAALILRVDSPGGSVFASEQIRRAVVRYRDSGRPVVVSMASVAASGGYWVSMNADEILAHPVTITGSIGIFGLVPTFEESLAKLGIRSDGVGTTHWSGGLSPMRPLSDAAEKGIQIVIEKDYRQFIERVAEAREMDVEAVDAVAQGQVWTGSVALDHGLIDQLGDFDAAVERAVALADLNNYEIAPVRAPLDFRFQFLQKFSLWGSLIPEPLNHMIAGAMGIANTQIRRWSDPRGSYAHCFCTPR